MISAIILVLAERFLQAPASFLIRKSNDKGNSSGREPCKDLLFILGLEFLCFRVLFQWDSLPSGCCMGCRWLSGGQGDK